MKEKALDIFELLGSLGSRDLFIWDKLDEAQRKGFAPLVVMRWLSGVNDPARVVFVNVTMNKNVFPLQKHPSLLMKLGAASCRGTENKRCQWLKQKKSKNDRASVAVVARYYECSKREATMHMRHLSIQDLVQMAEEMGMEKAEIDKIKKEDK